jgi:tetratricopeptide (TPR) repeat protein
MDPGFSIPDYSDLLELDLDENKTIISDEVVLNQEQLDYEEKNSKKQLQSKLIDKFIIANPRIEPVKEKTSLLVEDISKPFVEEEGRFVTETLARIYFNQGYYSKAIDIYEKLCLKFPEKSSYFASQIEKVKEYIKK